MTTKTIIKYVDEQNRAGWKTISDVKRHFTEAEIVEMCNRYQDAQRHAVAYRERAKIKKQVMADRLAELEAQLAGKQAGS